MSQKRESELDETWSLGTVDQLVLSRDGLARRAILRYQNAQENFHRVSDRNIRSVVKIWSVDDQNVDEDLAALHRRLRQTGRGSELVDQLLVHGGQGPAAPTPDLLQLDQVLAAASWACVSCCCRSHCKIGHTTDQQPATSLLRTLLSPRAVLPLQDLGHALHPQVEVDTHDEEAAEEELQSCECSLTALMNNLNLQLE